MAAQRIPVVRDDRLHAHPAAGPIPVGSPAWFAWLADPAHPSFAYRTAAGSVTLRRERRGAGWYWYAYRNQGGRVRKVYAGKAEELTAERLRALAATLAGGPARPAAPPGAGALVLLAYLAGLPWLVLAG
jgi:LuxR family maltose regulon positive regulatory protein